MHQMQNQTRDSGWQSQERGTDGGERHQEEKPRQGRRTLQMIPLFKLSQSWYHDIKTDQVRIPFFFFIIDIFYKI